ncbi:MAG: hypothetical protein MK209_04400 [Planctomycetes bacterium]|nr:hypothetical protein [Planctomycetota bacterium]
MTEGVHRIPTKRNTTELLHLVYQTTGSVSPMLLALARPLLLLAPFIAVALGASHTPPSVEPDTSSFGVRLAALTGAANEPLILLQKARQAAEREQRAETTSDAQAAARARDAFCAALAETPEAAALPWDKWIEMELRNRDALALGLYLASLRAQAPNPLQRAKQLGKRTSPVLVRMAAHRTLWALDPELALQQGRGLVHELPRGTTGMHTRYARVLAEVSSPLAQELLITMAHRDGLESHARVVAIQTLAKTGRVELGADFATIWNASTGDVFTRQQALLATLQLDPVLGERILLKGIPNSDAQPVLQGFVLSLIEARGLTPLPAN